MIASVNNVKTLRLSFDKIKNIVELSLINDNDDTFNRVSISFLINFIISN
jgi:hypothetical protein